MMSNFKCERVPALEYFLTRDYNGRIKPYIVWDDSKNIIVAYFTLITTCMILKPYEKTDPEHTKEKDVEKIISCIELEHFALNDVYLKLVNEDGYSNSGIGNYVFKEYISTVIAVLVSEVNFFYLILHAYNNDKVINAYRNMGFETMEDDAEAVIPTLSDVRALHSDYAGDCKFMFRDVESILTDLDQEEKLCTIIHKVLLWLYQEKKQEKMLSKSEKPIADHTKTIDRAKDKLRKMGKK